MQVESLDEWLKGLNIEARVAKVGDANVARTTQLLNKTNQLNLSTRRFSEAELVACRCRGARSMDGQRLRPLR